MNKKKSQTKPEIVVPEGEPRPQELSEEATKKTSDPETLLTAEQALELSRKYKMNLKHILLEIEKRALSGHRDVYYKDVILEEGVGEQLRELGFHVGLKSFTELVIEW